MMSDHFLTIQITQPGGVTGQYYPVELDTLRLEKILHPEDKLPFDVGILPKSLTPFDEPLTTIVLSSLSHPVNTMLDARLLGGMERPGYGFPILIVVPKCDDNMKQLEVSNLPTELREQVLAIIQASRPGKWQWRNTAEVEPTLHAAALRYRKYKNSERQIPEPAWQTRHLRPLSGSYLESEHYTVYEYTFQELPNHFQHYVRQILASDERILYAIRRPAISSNKRRGLIRRERMQAGVLILTNLRLIHLTELVPPDTTNIRYGFHTQVGVVERFYAAQLNRHGKNVVLSSEWFAQGGTSIIEWEIPPYTLASLEELLSFLLQFKGGDKNGTALVRCEIPEPPEKIPFLRDPAANDTDDLVRVNDYFKEILTTSLEHDEQARTWALIPEWHEDNKYQRVLVVTGKRVFLLPDLSLIIRLSDITIPEFTASILESKLVINWVNDGLVKQKAISFPYTAENTFRKCFEMIQRCMVVNPLV